MKYAIILITLVILSFLAGFLVGFNHKSEEVQPTQHEMVVVEVQTNVEEFKGTYCVRNARVLVQQKDNAFTVQNADITIWDNNHKHRLDQKRSK